MSYYLSQVPFVAIVSFIFARAALKIAANRVEEALVSTISAALYIVCLVIPAHLQSKGILISKLELAQILTFPNAREVAELSLAWACELIVILLGELAGGLIYTPNVRLFPDLRRLMAPVIGHVAGPEVRRVVAVLLAIGLPAAIFLRVSVEDRAEGGQGFTTILRNCLVVGLSLLAFNKFFSRKLYYFIGVAGTIILIVGKVRNPLLVVLAGFLAGMISRRQLKLGKAFGLLVVVSVLAVLAAWMSAMRAAIIRHENTSAMGSLVETISNPFVSIYGSGVDTLDGYRLSMQVLPYEKPHLESLATVFTTFVPRILWPNKPVEVSTEISERYANYGSGGMYLSPVGDLALSFGGYWWAVAAMFVFGAVSTWLVRTFIGSFVLSIILWTIITFILAGGAFVIYLGLAETIPLIAATMLVRIFRLEGSAGGFFSREGTKLGVSL